MAACPCSKGKRDAEAGKAIEKLLKEEKVALGPMR